MTEIQEMIEGKTISQLEKELDFQIKNGESKGGTICSAIIEALRLKRESSNCASVCIQDKNKRYYNTICGADYVAPEVRNMKRHLERAKSVPKIYNFLDLETAQILVNDEPLLKLSEEDDLLFQQLFGA